MDRWVITTKKADFDKIAEQFHISPYIARLLVNRGFTKDQEIEKFLYGDLSDLYSPELCKDISKAVEILLQKIAEGKKIRIVGDYDADGVMSSYILIRGLMRLGAQVDHFLPHRMRDGYGLSVSMVEQANLDMVDTILTCDNGISAFEAVEAAKSAGLTVIITDHHEIPFEDCDGKRVEQIPQADAVIDPKQQDSGYPFSGLCGAAVAWKLICSLYDKAGIDEGEAYEFLPYAAIATITDICSLIDENRIIVKEGLKRIKTTDNIGLRILIDKTGIDEEKIDVFHIGFMIGPCINASGRMASAELALRLLLTKDLCEAAELSEQLIMLNELRKNETEKGVTEALRSIEREGSGEDKVLAIVLKNCHESVAGIVAGRIKEMYYRPTFILLKNEAGYKGSGRSIEGYDMFDALMHCSDLCVKFGGHPMAAGVTIKEGHLQEFRERLNNNCKLKEEELTKKVRIDIALPLQYNTFELVEELKMLEPYGKDNPEPVFARSDLTFENLRLIGKEKNVLSLDLKDSSGSIKRAICFKKGLELYEQLQKDPQKVFIAYYPTINEYRDLKEVKLVITDFQAM